MFSLELKASPTYHDEYGQPCYPVSQRKGLIEFQENHLIKHALANGYTAAVATTLFDIIGRQVALASLRRPADVLEVGGGSGAFYAHVKNNVRTYINVEPGRLSLSGEALDRLKDPSYICLKCSAEEIPLPDESVDVILSIASFDHIPDYRKALAEVSRLLRKGGVFILTLNNRRSWWKAILARTAYLKRRDEEIAREHYFQWSFSECETHLAEFIPVRHIYTITFVPFIPHLWRLLLPLCDLFGRPLLRKYGANIIAVCQKPAGDGAAEIEPQAV